MKPHRDRAERATLGARGPRRWGIPLTLGFLLLAFLGVAGWMGYSYYEYRTFTGNPNLYPSYVRGFGTVKTQTFYSQALRQRVSYDAYLPPGYDDPKNAFARYPVVYLLHGSPGSYGDWVTVGGLDVKMDTLLAQKKARPMIVIMPQGSPFRFAPSTEYVDGPLGKWATYITKDLVNRVDRSCRTVASANGRAIAGLSEGGYGATNLGLQNRDEFGVIGSFSGYFALSASDPAAGGNKKLAEANSPAAYLPNLKGPLPRIYYYVGSGDRGYVRENARFAHALRAKGAPYEFHVFPGTHSWALWRAHLPDFLVFASDNLKGRSVTQKP